MTKKKDNGGTALAVTEEKFPALADGGNFLEAVRANLAGEPITPADLTRIKMPSGGATFWLIPTVDGEESAKALEGIIVHTCKRRAFWPTAKITGEPPMCASSDCIVGIGEPGGLCKTCLYNVFGTAQQEDGTPGRGKACKERRLVFLLREGRHLPDVVDASPGSLKRLRQWLLQLAPMKYCQVVTRLELEADTSRDGWPFARIKLTKLAELPPDAAEKILRYAQSLQELFAAVQIEPDEDNGEPAEV